MPNDNPPVQLGFDDAGRLEIRIKTDVLKELPGIDLDQPVTQPSRWVDGGTHWSYTFTSEAESLIKFFGVDDDGGCRGLHLSAQGAYRR